MILWCSIAVAVFALYVKYAVMPMYHGACATYPNQLCWAAQPPAHAEGVVAEHILYNVKCSESAVSEDCWSSDLVFNHGESSQCSVLVSDTVRDQRTAKKALQKYPSGSTHQITLLVGQGGQGERCYLPKGLEATAKHARVALFVAAANLVIGIVGLAVSILIILFG